MNAHTTYTSTGKSIPAELFHPSGSANRALVILAYGSDGLIDNANGSWKKMIEEYARDLAARGFVAAIPDYFTSTGTRPGELDVNNPLAYSEQILRYRGAWQTTIEDAITQLGNGIHIPGVDPKRVGLLGFSLGGYLCARLAHKVKALGIFFAPYLDGLGLNGTVPFHAEIHHGEKDFLPFKANTAVIDRDFKNHGGDSKLWPAYPDAVHGFATSDPANSNARQESHQRTMTFFQSKL